MNKRGAGHIEIILAFILFAAAIFVALNFFSPTNTSKLVDTSIDYAFQEIMKNTSIDSKTYTLIINASPLNQDQIAINFSSISDNFGVVTKDSQGNRFNSSKSGDFVYVNGPFSPQQILFVTFGEDVINSVITPFAEENKDIYKIASVNQEELISEKRFSLLKEAYELDYSSLRKVFNLPSRANFGFSLEFSNTDKISSTAKESNQEIKSEKRNVRVLRLNGDIVPAELYVRIW